jgi:hypothetical protein
MKSEDKNIFLQVIDPDGLRWVPNGMNNPEGSGSQSGMDGRGNDIGDK